MTSRHRLPGVTSEARTPGDLAQPGVWALQGHLRLSSEARRVLPPILGGLSRDVGYDVSHGSQAAILRAADMCPQRQALGKSLDMDSLGFAATEPALRVEDLHEDDPKERGSGEKDGKPPASRRRGSNGQFQADGGVEDGSPTRTLFGMTGDEGGGHGYHQATVRTLLHNREAKLNACAYITNVWGKFPCLRDAKPLETQI
jgi:hypothetical protein